MWLSKHVVPQDVIVNTRCTIRCKCPNYQCHDLLDYLYILVMSPDVTNSHQCHQKCLKIRQITAIFGSERVLHVSIILEWGKGHMLADPDCWWRTQYSIPLSCAIYRKSFFDQIPHLMPTSKISPILKDPICYDQKQKMKQINICKSLVWQFMTKLQVFTAISIIFRKELADLRQLFCQFIYSCNNN